MHLLKAAARISRRVETSFNAIGCTNLSFESRISRRVETQIDLEAPEGSPLRLRLESQEGLKPSSLPGPTTMGSGLESQEGLKHIYSCHYIDWYVALESQEGLKPRKYADKPKHNPGN